MTSRTIISRSPAETFGLARRLGTRIAPGQVFALRGPLGSGKTVFAQGMLAGAGVEAQVTSPTFTLMQAYEGRLPVLHADAYRLEDGTELERLGLHDALARGAAAVIEWADRAEAALTAERLDVFLCYHAEGARARRIRLRARGDAYGKLLQRALPGAR